MTDVTECCWNKREIPSMKRKEGEDGSILCARVVESVVRERSWEGYWKETAAPLLLGSSVFVVFTGAVMTSRVQLDSALRWRHASRGALAMV